MRLRVFIAMVQRGVFNYKSLTYAPCQKKPKKAYNIKKNVVCIDILRN